MKMTDAEAKDEIDGILIAHAQCAGCPTCIMLRFCLRSIDDRAALLSAYHEVEMTTSDGAGHFRRVMALQLVEDAARRHMRGEE